MTVGSLTWIMSPCDFEGLSELLRKVTKLFSELWSSFSPVCRSAVVMSGFILVLWINKCVISPGQY